MQKLSEISLPENRKFGFFFTIIFFIISAYCLKENFLRESIISFGTGLVFLIIAIVKPELLLSINKLWMRFGFVLGMIVSPIVLGAIFFGLFTPVAIGMRLIGRDELKLKIKKITSFWKLKEPNQLLSTNFNNQF